MISCPLSESRLKRIIEKLEKYKVIKGNGCWELITLPSYHGYTYIFLEGEEYRANRISAAYYLGLDYEDKKKLALHKNTCNNRGMLES